MSDESEAILLTNQVLLGSLIQVLKAKFIISAEDEREVYESALLSLEEEHSRLQGQDENLEPLVLAREILGQLFK